MNICHRVGKLSSTISSSNLSLTLSMKTTLRPVYRLIRPYAVSTSVLLMAEALLTEDFGSHSKGLSLVMQQLQINHILYPWQVKSTFVTALLEKADFKLLHKFILWLLHRILFSKQKPARRQQCASSPSSNHKSWLIFLPALAVLFGCYAVLHNKFKKQIDWILDDSATFLWLAKIIF